MKTLSYLNSVSETEIAFTDVRDPNVIFDRPYPIDYSFTELNRTFQITLGLNIIEIVNPAEANVRYQINLGTTQASLDWGILPNGVTATGNGTIYTLYGIDSISDWETVKQPTIILDDDFQGRFSYDVKVIYATATESSKTVEYNVGVYSPAALLETTASMEIQPNVLFGGTVSLDNYFNVTVLGIETLGAQFFIDTTPTKIIGPFVATTITSEFSLNAITGLDAPFNVIYTNSNPNIDQTSNDDEFGYSADITQTHFVVGAYLEDDEDGDNNGVTYVYRRDGLSGELLYTINNYNAYSITDDDDNSSHSVAINSNYVFVGAPREDSIHPSAENQGKVYVYDLSDGSHVRTIDNPNPSDESKFGWGIEANDNYVLIRDTGNVTVYVYNNSGSSLVRQISDGTDLRYATDMVLDGDTAVISDPGFDVDTYDRAGRVHAYDLTTGNLTYTLINPNPEDNGRFGQSVAKNGEYISVGTVLQSQVYTFYQGSLLHTINPPDSSIAFGQDLTIVNNFLVVRAPADAKIHAFDITDGSLTYTTDYSYGGAINYSNRFRSDGNNSFIFEQNEIVTVYHKGITKNSTITETIDSTLICNAITY